MSTATKYHIIPIPQPELSTCRAWDVLGGTEDYVVKCDAMGEWVCSCPDWSKSPGGRRDLRRRQGGCKHIHKVKCFTGDHKFMPTLHGPECVRCGISQAEYEYREGGPPDPPFTPDRRDY